MAIHIDYVQMRGEGKRLGTTEEGSESVGLAQFSLFYVQAKFIPLAVSPLCATLISQIPLQMSL